MSILTKIKELKELEKQGTSGPFETYLNRVIHAKTGINCIYVSTGASTIDAKRIAKHLNSLPEILEFLDEALEAMLAHPNYSEMYGNVEWEREWLTPFKKKWGLNDKR